MAAAAAGAIAAEPAAGLCHAVSVSAPAAAGAPAAARAAAVLAATGAKRERDRTVSGAHRAKVSALQAWPAELWTGLYAYGADPVCRNSAIEAMPMISSSLVMVHHCISSGFNNAVGSYSLMTSTLALVRAFYGRRQCRVYGACAASHHPARAAQEEQRRGADWELPPIVVLRPRPGTAGRADGASGRPGHVRSDGSC